MFPLPDAGLVEVAGRGLGNGGSGEKQQECERQGLHVLGTPGKWEGRTGSALTAGQRSRKSAQRRKGEPNARSKKHDLGELEEGCSEAKIAWPGLSEAARLKRCSGPFAQDEERLRPPVSIAYNSASFLTHLCDELEVIDISGPDWPVSCSLFAGW
jgi:hypothetical protein